MKKILFLIFVGDNISNVNGINVQQQAYQQGQQQSSYPNARYQGGYQGQGENAQPYYPPQSQGGYQGQGVNAQPYYPPQSQGGYQGQGVNAQPYYPPQSQGGYQGQGVNAQPYYPPQSQGGYQGKGVNAQPYYPPQSQGGYQGQGVNAQPYYPPQSQGGYQGQGINAQPYPPQQQPVIIIHNSSNSNNGGNSINTNNTSSNSSSSGNNNAPSHPPSNPHHVKYSPMENIKFLPTCNIDGRAYVNIDDIAPVVYPVTNILTYNKNVKAKTYGPRGELVFYNTETTPVITDVNQSTREKLLKKVGITKAIYNSRFHPWDLECYRRQISLIYDTSGLKVLIVISGLVSIVVGLIIYNDEFTIAPQPTTPISQSSVFSATMLLALIVNIFYPNRSFYASGFSRGFFITSNSLPVISMFFDKQKIPPNKNLDDTDKEMYKHQTEIFVVAWIINLILFMAIYGELSSIPARYNTNVRKTNNLSLRKEGQYLLLPKDKVPEFINQVLL